jgi:hypothetical protein
MDAMAHLSAQSLKYSVVALEVPATRMASQTRAAIVQKWWGTTCGQICTTGTSSAGGSFEE